MASPLPSKPTFLSLLLCALFLNSVSAYDAYLAVNCPDDYANGKSTAVWYYGNYPSISYSEQPGARMTLATEDVFKWEGQTIAVTMDDAPSSVTPGYLTINSDGFATQADQFVGSYIKDDNLYACRRSSAGTPRGTIGNVGCAEIYYCLPWSATAEAGVTISQEYVELARPPTDEDMAAVWDLAWTRGFSSVGIVGQVQGPYHAVDVVVNDGQWRSFGNFDRETLIDMAMKTWSKMAEKEVDCPCRGFRCVDTFCTTKYKVPARLQLSIIDPRQSGLRVAFMDIAFSDRKSSTDFCSVQLNNLGGAAGLAGAFNPVAGGVASVFYIGANIFCAFLG